jgi:hypothetical protein
MHMTNEEMETTMQFIVQQQAQFTANFQKLDEERAKDSARIKHLEESFTILVQLAGNHNERMTALDERTIALTERTISLDERMIVLDERMIALTEAQIRTDEQLKETSEQMKETDERLNSLILVVENYIASRGQNGSSQS